MNTQNMTNQEMQEMAEFLSSLQELFTEDPKEYASIQNDIDALNDEIDNRS